MQRRKWVVTIPFNEERWKINNAAMRWEVRPGMARDLIKRELLIGKNCKEINDLLTIYNYVSCDENVVEFELKQFYSTNIDPSAIEYLYIYYDENNKVKNAEVKLHFTGE